MLTLNQIGTHPTHQTRRKEWASLLAHASIILLLFLPACSPAVSSSPNAAEKPPDVTLQLTLGSDKWASLQESALFHLRITNHSTAPIQLPGSMFGLDTNLFIRIWPAKDGVISTEHLCAILSTPPFQGASDDVLLGPGESFSFDVSFGRLISYVYNPAGLDLADEKKWLVRACMTPSNQANRQDAPGDTARPRVQASHLISNIVSAETSQ